LDTSTDLAPGIPDPSEFPIVSPDGICLHLCYAAIIKPTGQIYTDQTGKFVAPSSTGNNYLLVLYNYDSNAILAEPLKNRTAASILIAYKAVHSTLCAAGLRPQLQCLDNERSAILKDFMHDKHVHFQLVPPGMHRRNAAERAIHTFKNHFIASFCSVNKDFPIHLWVCLLLQALLSLNLLRGSRLNPKLSAWAQLHPNFEFNPTPIAPPGFFVIVHEKPDKHTSWSPHGVDEWYVGPALESYRCYNVWVWDTQKVRICDTISWFPTKVAMPIASSNDLILAGITDILDALCHPSPGLPLVPLTDSHVTTLKLSELIASLVAAPPSNAPITDLRPALRVPSPEEQTLAPPLRVATLIKSD
jgi:hypothetical protein